jgi:hypothetical protein
VGGDVLEAVKALFVHDTVSRCLFQIGPIFIASVVGGYVTLPGGDISAKKGSTVRS